MADIIINAGEPSAKKRHGLGCALTLLVVIGVSLVLYFWALAPVSTQAPAQIAPLPSVVVYPTLDAQGIERAKQEAPATDAEQNYLDSVNSTSGNSTK